MSSIDNKDIKKIELTYETHCCIDLEELFNPEDGETNPFAEGRVKGWWVKYGTLYIKLDDWTETTIEKDVSWWTSDTYENVDTKHPSAIHVEDEEGGWHRRDVQ